MAISYDKKQEVRKYLKSIGCTSVQFRSRSGLQYLKVEWPSNKIHEAIVKGFVYKNFTGSYVTSGGVGNRTFRIFNDNSQITTNQAANAVKELGLQKELSEVLLKADCSLCLSELNQYEWMAKHAIEFLKKGGYLK